MNNIENKKLKVGILTFHRAHNYGAVLQCYALQETLKSLGYDAWVIDYRQPTIESEPIYKILSLPYVAKCLIHPRAMYGYLKDIPSRVKRFLIYNNFRKKFFHLSEPCYNAQRIPSTDVYLIGSDQLWNTGILRKGMDDVYTGTFNKGNGRILSYAISGNMQSVTRLSDEYLKGICGNFEVLSFREEDIAENVSKRTGNKVRIDLDPTLLLEDSAWDNFTYDVLKGKRYVLIYQVRYPKPPMNIKALNIMAENLAKKLGCEVINIMGRNVYSPQEFVSLIKYAQYVVTSSFHATVFSVIFGRPLYSVKLHDGWDGRYENLLNALGAQDLLADVGCELEPKEVDVAVMQTKLAELRKDSLNYLSLIKNK